MMNLSENLPLYHRITHFADATSGEFLFCPLCHEVNALCPDCGAEVCCTCADECPGCETPMF